MKKERHLKIEHINTPKKAGVALKRIRKLQSLSQQDLARMMNMRQPTVSDLENGRGTLDSFFKIVQALKVNLQISNPDLGKVSSSGESKVRKMLNYLDKV